MILIGAFSFSLYSTEIGVVPKIGGGLSYISGVQFPRSKFSYTIGASTIFHFSDFVFADISLFYQKKGSWGKKMDFDVSYISVPVTAGFLFIDELSLFAGPQINFLINAQYKGLDITSYTEPISFDIIFGASYFFPFSTSRLMFELRFEFGVSDFSKSNNLYLVGIHKNRSAYLIMGYEFFIH